MKANTPKSATCLVLHHEMPLSTIGVEALVAVIVALFRWRRSYLPDIHPMCRLIQVDCNEDRQHHDITDQSVWPKSQTQVYSVEVCGICGVFGFPAWYEKSPSRSIEDKERVTKRERQEI